MSWTVAGRVTPGPLPGCLGMSEIPDAEFFALPVFADADDGPRVPLLSLAEARAVVVLLREHGGVDARQLAAELAMRLPAESDA